MRGVCGPEPRPAPRRIPAYDAVMSGDAGAPPPLTAREVGTLLLGVVQVALGAAAGVGVAFFCYPRVVFTLLDAIGLNGPQAPVGHGTDTPGYWAVWILSFAVVPVLLWPAYRLRATRAFVVAMGIAFVATGLPVALLMISLDSGGFGPS